MGNLREGDLKLEGEREREKWGGKRERKKTEKGVRRTR